METQRFAHWRDAAGPAWTWSFFSPREMACRASHQLVITDTLMDILMRMRLEWGRMIVTSGHRSATHNRNIGGAENSEHVTGEAADIAVQPYLQDDFIALARAKGAVRIGQYPDRGFIHVGVRPVERERQKFWIRWGRR